MTLDFDLGRVSVMEFGVGRDDGDEQTFVTIPVDRNVQNALYGMVQATLDAMKSDEGELAKYEPSEKYGSEEYCFLPLDNDMATFVRELHEAVNLTICVDALDELSSVFCYFVRMTDESEQRLTALRRASQFKGVLAKRLICFVTDSLKLIEDKVFKLDNDFDFLVDSRNVHILRPNGFESVGKLKSAILEAAPRNIDVIQEYLPFVKFESIKPYAIKHLRAARCLASIRRDAEINRIDKALLKALCEQTNVAISVLGEKIVITNGHEMGFLEVLDRRRYAVSLIEEEPEHYRAASRRRINGQPLH